MPASASLSTLLGCLLVLGEALMFVSSVPVEDHGFTSNVDDRISGKDTILGLISEETHTSAKTGSRAGLRFNFKNHTVDFPPLGKPAATLLPPSHATAIPGNNITMLLQNKNKNKFGSGVTSTCSESDGASSSDCLPGFQWQAPQETGWGISHYFIGDASNPTLGFTLSTGTGFMTCDNGANIEDSSNVGGFCDNLPLNDAEGFNAVGRAAPVFKINAFGLTFDVAGAMGSSAAGYCFAFSKCLKTFAVQFGNEYGVSLVKSHFHQTAAGVNFYNVNDCNSTAECASYVGATPFYLLPQPYITFQPIGMGRSEDREFTLTTSLGLWNGNSELSSIKTTPFTAYGSLWFSAVLSFTAFKVGSVSFGIYVSGDILVDAVGVDDMTAGFGALMRGDFGSLSGGFQITMKAAAAISVDLGSLNLWISVGDASGTLGVGMGSYGYSGFSDGMYFAYNANLCLTDLFPPLGYLEAAKCNGQSLFNNLCVDATGGFYASVGNGLGYGFEFTATLASVSATYSALMTFSASGSGSYALETTLGGCTINGNTISIGAKMSMGFSLTSLDADFSMSVWLAVGDDNVLGGLFSNILNKVTDTFKDWLGLEQQLQLLQTNEKFSKSAHGQRLAKLLKAHGKTTLLQMSEQIKKNRRKAQERKKMEKAQSRMQRKLLIMVDDTDSNDDSAKIAADMTQEASDLEAAKKSKADSEAEAQAVVSAGKELLAADKAKLKADAEKEASDLEAAKKSKEKIEAEAQAVMSAGEELLTADKAKLKADGEAARTKLQAQLAKASKVAEEHQAKVQADVVQKEADVQAGVQASGVPADVQAGNTIEDAAEPARSGTLLETQTGMEHASEAEVSEAEVSDVRARGKEAKMQELERSKDTDARHPPSEAKRVRESEAKELDLFVEDKTAAGSTVGGRRRRWGHRHHWHHRHHNHHWHHRHHNHHWHHRHHRHHWHWNIGDIVPDWLTSWIPEPSISLSGIKASGDLCGFYIEMTGSVGIDISSWGLGSPSKSFTVKVSFSATDLMDAIIDAFVDAFTALKSSFV